MRYSLPMSVWRIGAVAATVGLIAGLTGCSSSSTADSASSANASVVTSNDAVNGGTSLDAALPPALLSLPLVDQARKQFSLSQLGGKTIVLTDFLTTCQEICPMTSVNMQQVTKAVADAGMSNDVVVLEGTVNPERDNPTRLEAYQKLFPAAPGWTLFTAGTQGTSKFWKALGVDYSKVPGDKPYPKDWLTGQPLTYDVNHQDVVMIIGPDGHEQWVTIGTPNTSGIQPPSTLANFLSSEGQTNLKSPPQPAWTAAQIEAQLSKLTGHQIGNA